MGCPRACRFDWLIDLHKESSHKWHGCMLTTAPAQTTTCDVECQTGRAFVTGKFAIVQRLECTKCSFAFYFTCALHGLPAGIQVSLHFTSKTGMFWSCHIPHSVFCSRTPGHIPQWFTQYRFCISPTSPISGGSSSQYGWGITMAWNPPHLTWACSGVHLVDWIQIIVGNLPAKSLEFGTVLRNTPLHGAIFGMTATFMFDSRNKWKVMQHLALKNDQCVHATVRNNIFHPPTSPTIVSATQNDLHIPLWKTFVKNLNLFVATSFTIIFSRKSLKFQL